MAKKKKNTARKKTGWAFTKFFPHLNHPSHYKKTDKDEVEYITFTHSAEVDSPKGKVKTVPLTDNVGKKEREENKKKGLPKGENKSYAYPKVYKGKRSALGKETDEYSFANDEDKKIVDNMFNTFPKENVPKTSSSKKKKP